MFFVTCILSIIQPCFVCCEIPIHSHARSVATGQSIHVVGILCHILWTTSCAPLILEWWNRIWFWNTLLPRFKQMDVIWWWNIRSKALKIKWWISCWLMFRSIVVIIWSPGRYANIIGKLCTRISGNLKHKRNSSCLTFRHLWFEDVMCSKQNINKSPYWQKPNSWFCLLECFANTLCQVHIQNYGNKSWNYLE